MVLLQKLSLASRSLRGAAQNRAVPTRDRRPRHWMAARRSHYDGTVVTVPVPCRGVSMAATPTFAPVDAKLLIMTFGAAQLLRAFASPVNERPIRSAEAPS